MAALRKEDDNDIHLHYEDDLNTLQTSLSGHGPRHETMVVVDRDDDLASLRSKLESSRAPRVVVEIPSSAKILREGLEFRVLRRLQRELGADMVLVIGDSGRRAMAKENGFARVYPSISSYRRGRVAIPLHQGAAVPFTDPEEFNPATSIGKLGALVGFALLMLVGAIAYFALPVATVTVYAEPRALSRDVEVVVELGGPPMDVTAQRLSGQLAEAQVTVQDSIALKDVPASPNPSGFEAGSQVTVEAREALRNRLMEQANGRLGQQLRTSLPANHSMPEASIRTEIVSERYDHDIGERVDTLSGTLEMKATAVGFSNDNFNRLVQSIWSQEVPRNYRVADGPNLTPPAVVVAEPRHTTLRVRASGRLQSDLNTDSLVNAVRGHSMEEANRQLGGMTVGTRPPGVTIWPEWADRAYRVQVQTSPDPARPSQIGGNQADR